MQERALRRLEATVRTGVNWASRALRDMTGSHVGLEYLRLEIVPVAALPTATGHAEDVVSAVYIALQGDINGHLVMCYSRDDARRLVGLLAGNAESPEMSNQVAQSALMEVGNICGGQMVTAIADETRLRIIQSPPQYVEDMFGAIMQTIAADLYLAGDRSMLIATQIAGLSGHLMLLPRPGSLKRLLGALGAPGGEA